ncbi:MAG TPA: nickel pincer cofactor biosynthesis protein LarC [Candidatus Angelobacter sp.]|nr:nickel pincer cofactor biosynthesis protein LarC [Candidatus Angelobacter sp.]
MRIAYLECFSGISGDMFLGALLDAGVPPEVFTRTVEALGVDARLEISRVDRSGISATKLDVIAAGEKELPREEFWAEALSTQQSALSPATPSSLGHAHSHAEEHEKALSTQQSALSPRHSTVEHSHDHGPSSLDKHSHSHRHEHSYGDDESHSHSHEHSHDHSHSPEDSHSHSHEHSHEHGSKHTHSHRGLKEIRQIIQAAGISQSAKDRAIKIFEALGAAEAKVHNTDIEKIHFHEVGAIDAIVDIVCASVGAEALGVDEWICSPLNVGGGTVVCAHGTFPIPAPATLELLKNAPVYSGEIQKELVTPTGAAIVRVLASRFSQFPTMKTEKIGYGAGTRNFKNSPNVLRLTIGETTSAQHESPFPVEEITVLEANVDDMTPQVFGYVMEQALQSGALDAFGTPVQMKKSRPGMLLTVLCRNEDSQGLTKFILAETTTLGVRMRRESRAALTRRHVSVSTKWGNVRMKLANLNGSISNYAPEYEDCRQIAKEKKVPLKTVMQEAIKVYLENTNG